ncbi:MAG: undecaprenyl-diphosphate phosphatase [Acidobacteriota bacterium]|nr:undecaprenyl-diphosphate phosphatase [Acidobacteriota bacterium]
MQLWHAILLGLIQGLTEFLPVSSTAHLTLAEHLLLGRGMPLAFDVLLHVGTLLALCVYFRKELAQVFLGILGKDPEGRKLAIWLFIAMIPTGVFGLATKGIKEAAKQHLWVYGIGLVVTAWMLFLANERSKQQAGREVEALNAKDALAIGAIQGLGGGFGLSRSGSTISVGVFSGLKLPASTRFSFLLGIPTIAAAALVEAKDLVKPWMRHLPMPDELRFPAGSINPVVACIAGVAVAAASGYFAIGLLDRFTRAPRLNGFAFYCLCMGLAMVILGTVGVDGFFYATTMQHP